MKKKNKKIFVGTLATLLILGGTSAVVGVASDGFKNWDTSTWFQDEFKDVKIESKTVIFDGTNKELDIVVPEGATYETKISKDGNEVNECNEIGIYHYIVTIKIGDKTKIFEADLIISADNQLPTKVEAKNIKIRTLKVEALSTGEIVKTISYSVQPTDADPTIKVASILKGGSDASDIVSVEINTANKEITLTCHEAFDEQIIVKVVHGDNSDINATITCDYRKKLVSKAFGVSLGEYGSISNSQIILDAYKIYNEFSSSGTFTFNPKTAIVQNFNYSIGTLEYEKSAVSASTKMSLGNNYSSSSSLQNLYYSQGAYINLKDGDSLTFSVNNNFKNVVNGVYGLVSNYKIGEVSFTDECGERRSFMLELDSSGSFLDSLSIDQNNVIF